MKGLRIQCPNCKMVRHVTTEHYVPDQTPKGNFVELIDPWKSWHWNCFDDEGEGLSTTPCSLMTCPGCAAPLAPTGRLTIAVDPEKQKEKQIEGIVGMWKGIVVDGTAIATGGFTCDVCGKVCKSLAGLKAHKRSHKN